MNYKERIHGFTKLSENHRIMDIDWKIVDKVESKFFGWSQEVIFWKFNQELQFFQFAKQSLTIYFANDRGSLRHQHHDDDDVKVWMTRIKKSSTFYDSTDFIDDRPESDPHETRFIHYIFISSFWRLIAFHSCPFLLILQKNDIFVCLFYNPFSLSFFVFVLSDDRQHSAVQAHNVLAQLALTYRCDPWRGILTSSDDTLRSRSYRTVA